MPDAPLLVGEPAPWFMCRTGLRERFSFDTVAGRYIVLSFLGSAADPAVPQFLAGLGEHRQRFDDVLASFFGVSVDPEDVRQARIADVLPGVRFFHDFDRAVSTLYRTVAADGHVMRTTFVLDPALRVLAVLPWGTDVADHVACLLQILDRLPPIPPEAPARPQAPVLVVPRVFEPGLCRALIEYFEARGGRESGFMVEQAGRTVTVTDPGHKRRRDCIVQDEALTRACGARLHTRLAPMIARAFQFDAHWIERHLVACYESDDGGHFRPHRDNTTKGTAHRRFAVSLFLNTGEYEGGQLRFPEFGRALYRAPTGGAVVFSCSLLHEATPVTRGRRFMYLPFLYDEPARRIREENCRLVESDWPSESSS